MSDGIRLSRWHRKRKTPFGQEFKYTDATELTGKCEMSSHNFVTDPGYFLAQMLTLSLPKFRLPRFRRARLPIAWVVVDMDESNIATANMVPPAEVRVSLLEARAMFPVYDEDLIMAADFYESEQTNGGPKQAGG